MTAADPAAGSAPLALVMGASRGLGLLIARELGRRGHQVVIAARDRATLQRAADWLAADGVSAQAEVCDVADAGAVQRLVDRVDSADRPIEVMICVAGVIQVGPLAALERRDFATAIDIMLWGPINTSLAVVDRMRQRGRGRIGIISSVGGLVAVPHLLPYSTAKFGAVGFGRGLRAELTGTGVTVTTVTPGLTRTGSHLRAQFLGNQGGEFTWFSAGATLPGVSMDAERTAVRIVDAVLVGRAQLVTTPLAVAGMWVNGLAPNLTAAALGVMKRLLPQPPDRPRGPRVVEGWQAERQLGRGIQAAMGTVTVLGRRAAKRYNEHPAGQPPR